MGDSEKLDESKEVAWTLSKDFLRAVQDRVDAMERGVSTAEVALAASMLLVEVMEDEKGDVRSLAAGAVAGILEQVSWIKSVKIEREGTN